MMRGYSVAHKTGRKNTMKTVTTGDSRPSIRSLSLTIFLPLPAGIRMAITNLHHRAAEYPNPN